MNHLKFVALSFQEWARDNGGHFAMQLAAGVTSESGAVGGAASRFRVLSNYLDTPTFVWCPQDEGRLRASSFGPSFGDSNVSYFVNLDAEPDRGKLVLCGDRKIAIDGAQAGSGLLRVASNAHIGWTKDIHQRKGNVVFVDGHTEQWESAQVQAAFRTNSRVLIP